MGGCGHVVALARCDNRSHIRECGLKSEIILTFIWIILYYELFYFCYNHLDFKLYIYASIS